MHHLRRHPRNQRQDKDLPPHGTVKHGAFRAILPRKIRDHLTAAYYSDLRIIHAAEGIETLGPLFSCTGSQDHLSVKDQGYSLGAGKHCVPETVQYILAGIRVPEKNRFLGSGHDDGLRRLLDQIGQCRRSVCHGIRPVGHHKTVVGIVREPDLFGNAEPAFRRHIGAVQIHELHCFRFADLTDLRHCRQKLGGGDCRRQSVSLVQRCDGASCGDH